MPILGSWLPSAEVQVLIGFHLFILLMLALDLGVFQRRAHAISMREAAVWSAVWISFALLFAIAMLIGVGDLRSGDLLRVYTGDDIEEPDDRPTIGETAQ